MKLGVLIDRINVGGVEKCAIQEVREGQKMGLDVKLLVLRRDSLVEKGYQNLLEGVSVEYLDDRIPCIFKFSFKVPGFAFFSLFHLTYPLLMPFYIKRKEWEHIVVHGSYTALTALSLKTLKNISYAIYFWDPIKYIIQRVYTGAFPAILIRMYSLLGMFFDRLLTKNSSRVLVGSVAHDAYLTTFVDKSKIKIVSPGTHLGRVRKRKKSYVLLVTSWKKGKHPEYVFELAKRLPGVTFKLVGAWMDPTMRADFEAQALQRGLAKQIEVVGRVAEQELPKYYSSALLHLTTNLEKGFGMPVLEAAANGTVSIVPKGSGVCSVFEPGYDALFAEEKDTGAIVSYIRLLFDDKDKAREMGLLAYERVKKGYTWAVHAKKVFSAVDTSAGS
jgi:glycosyltransferase involved in cell wall biosynthesis